MIMHNCTISNASPTITAAVEQLLGQLEPASEVATTRATCLALAGLRVNHESVLIALKQVQRSGPEAVRGAALWALAELGQAERLGLVKVPAGLFLMGSDVQLDAKAQGHEQPQHALYLPDYYLGRTPVTNTQYEAFVQATRHRPPDHWQGRIRPPQGQDDHPVVHVSWHDAVAYCRWLGASLPSEAQWEKGARGTDGRLYPWGYDFESSRCNTHEGRQTGMTPVDAYPQGASPYGLLDMAGNAWEWCATAAPGGKFKPYPYQADEDEWTEEYLNLEGGRAQRGGSWDFTAHFARSAGRDRTNPSNHLQHDGFRVALVSPHATQVG
jgi:formylglycine-generating enzyme required for sulfatase activity